MDTDIISIANFREQSFENNNMKKTSKNIVKIKNGSKNLNSTKENSEMKINFIGYADKKNNVNFEENMDISSSIQKNIREVVENLNISKSKQRLGKYF